MKVELFALCQGAFNNNGQLTIVNTIDNFSVSNLPTRLSFGLALKFYLEPHEESGDKMLEISVVRKMDKQICVPPMQIPVQISDMGKASHISLAMNLQNVLFENEGAYDVHMVLDGNRLDDFAFEVLKHE